MAAYPDEIKIAAKMMYLRRCKPREIAAELNLNNDRVVYQWAEKGNWEAMLQHETVEQAISRRLVMLADKDNKTESDLTEMDRLINQLDKLAGIDAKKARAAREAANAERRDEEGGGRESKGAAKRRKKKTKNDISDITPEQLEKVRKELFYDYQQNWHDNKHQRRRFILKSRQIGATYYFAWEALEDAIVNGDNQVFISASRAQAEIFKAYIIGFGKQYLDIEFTGNPIVLSNIAAIQFMSTSISGAQGYNGHTYYDEVFWTPNWEKFNTVTSAMAAHKKWRRTYFSTPSVKSHGAYPLWSGDKYNEKRKKNPVEFDLTHATLKNGYVGPDKIWRNIVTVKDAQEHGCNLFDIDELIEEYTEAEFNTLFMCAFMESGLSVFKLDDLLDCGVDSNVVWVDFKAKIRRPYGDNEVWIGYDPARSGDGASIVVVAPPKKDGEKFRVLEKLVMRKKSWQYQANRIKDLCEKYKVTFIGIDTTGPGSGVFDMVKTFFKRATSIHYSRESKTDLVIKAMDVIESGRMQWDEDHLDIAQAFLQIRQTTTGGDQITYVADRSSKTGHADVAWAIMHAISHEPLAGRRKKARVGARKKQAA